MFKIDLQLKVKNFKALEKFRKEVRTELIENGFDTILEESMDKLKDDLKSLINSKMPEDKQEEFAQDLEEEYQLVLPKSEEELIKHITGLDIPKLRKTKDYTTSVESNVIVSKDYRLKLRFPISPDETFEENYGRAKQFFNNAMFVFRQGTQTRYILNPGIDLSQFIKVVCSTDVGDTEDSRGVFDSYRNSKKRPRQNTSEIGRYAEWSLKQEGVKQILNTKNGFIDFTSIINDIKQGNIEDALSKLDNIKATNINIPKIKDRINDLKTNTELGPNIQAYVSMLNIINSLGINKKINKEGTTYSLDSDAITTSEDNKDFDTFYKEMLRQLKIWSELENKIWIEKFKKKAEELIKLFEKAS